MRRPDRARRGAAALELALVLPLLLGFVLMMLDLAQLVSHRQQVSAAAAAAADLAASVDDLAPAAGETEDGQQIDPLALAASMAAHPAPLLKQGSITVTSLVDDGHGPMVVGQQHWGHGDKPDLADALAIAGSGALVQVDVSLTVQPWRLSGGLLGMPGELQLHQRAIRRRATPLKLAS